MFYLGVTILDTTLVACCCCCADIGFRLGMARRRDVRAIGVQTEHPVVVEFGIQAEQTMLDKEMQCEAMATRTMASMSQCTYTRHRIQPRFVPLGEASRGCWGGT